MGYGSGKMGKNPLVFSRCDLNCWRGHSLERSRRQLETAGLLLRRELWLPTQLCPLGIDGFGTHTFKYLSLFFFY